MGFSAAAAATPHCPAPVNELMWARIVLHACLALHALVVFITCKSFGRNSVPPVLEDGHQKEVVEMAGSTIHSAPKTSGHHSKPPRPVVAS